MVLPPLSGLGDHEYETGVLVLVAVTLAVALTQVSEIVLAERLTVGIFASGTTVAVEFAETTELQPDTVLVTTTVNTPVPLATGF